MATETKYIDVPFEIKAEDITEEGVFEGHGSLFDQVPDDYRDLVARGAFKESIDKGGRNKTGIAMLWQHGSREMPPGVWLSLQEDTKGLRVKGQLALDTQIGKEAYSLMKLGAKTGMWRFSLSIGYDSLEEEFHTPEGQDRKIRTIKKAELWEISIVNFPAKLGATVENIKSIQEAKTIRDIEDALRDSGLSKTEAQHFIAICKEALRDSEDLKNVLKETPNDNSPLPGILDSLKKFNKDIDTTGILNSLQRINS